MCVHNIITSVCGKHFQESETVYIYIHNDIYRTILMNVLNGYDGVFMTKIEKCWNVCFYIHFFLGNIILINVQKCTEGWERNILHWSQILISRNKYSKGKGQVGNKTNIYVMIFVYFIIILSYRSLTCTVYIHKSIFRIDFILYWSSVVLALSNKIKLMRLKSN